VDEVGNWGGPAHLGPFCIGGGIAPPRHVFLPLALREYSPPRPDLRTSTKTADKAGVNAGEPLAYAIVLENSGDLTATVALADPVPAQTTFVESRAPDCIYDAGDAQIEWNGTLNPGQSHTCNFTVTVDNAASGSIVNTATASYPSALALVATTPVMVTNGGFETGDSTGWQVSGDAVLPAPQAVTTDPHAGNYDLLLGTPEFCNAPNPGATGDHASIARQTIYVPDVEGRPVLKFWYRVFTYDHLTWTDGRIGDSLDVYVSGELALRDNYENRPDPSPGCSSLQDSSWREPDPPWGGEIYRDVLNLSEFKGKQVEVRFELWTRWDGYYNTWAYVDDVRVEVEIVP